MSLAEIETDAVAAPRLPRWRALWEQASRRVAIRAEELMDVTDIAHAVGFHHRASVALTRSAWESCIGDEGSVIADVGALFDVLGAAVYATRVQRNDPSRAPFSVSRPTHRIALLGECAYGDAGEPVVTIMLRREAKAETLTKRFPWNRLAGHGARNAIDFEADVPHRER